MLLIDIRSTNASTAQFISNRSRLHVKLFKSTCRSSGTTTPDQTTTTTKSERVEMNESNESKCIFRARPEYFLSSIDVLTQCVGYTCGIGSHPLCFWHIFCYRTMKFTALFLLSASATGAAFVPPTGYGTSVPHGESALAAKRDLLRSIFRRPSRLAAKVSSVLFFYLCPSLAS